MTKAADHSKLTVVGYPDPRLRVKCRPVERFDAELASLAARMLELMREHKGVGLAAAQVGLPIRMFVMNTTDDPKNDLVLVNPVLHDLIGAREDEEGCLSIPDVRVQVRRATRARLTAQDLAGNPVEYEATEYPARVWQHETDHLDGVLIIDRMGPGDRIATRKALRDFEERFEARSGARPPAKKPPAPKRGKSRR